MLKITFLHMEKNYDPGFQVKLSFGYEIQAYLEFRIRGSDKCISPPVAISDEMTGRARIAVIDRNFAAVESIMDGIAEAEQIRLGWRDKPSK